MILRRRKRRAVGLWNAIFLLSSLMAGTHAAPNSKLTSLFSDRGGSSTVNSMSSNTPMRVAYQGEPGAYSEKATRELLGSKVTAIGRPSFEDCFRAVASMECDYACLPIENSLGGSIHENYDLMLRYDLTIVGEHEFRVHHCLLAKPGVKREDIKYAISHPQALAQCDNFLRGLDITPIPTYDTAGSAKMISEGTKLPGKCTPENTAAIASDLAGTTYGLNCLDKGIEDDDTNFTRFLLLARKGVVEFLNKQIPSKTSVVFTLHNTAGALYKALACFSLRDIDCSKIESRPTSASLLNFLKFRSQQQGRKSRNKADLPRFRYCFYLDFLASELDENTQNALSHLREQADFIRILGSYPTKSRLVGPVKAAAEETANMVIDPKDFSLATLPSDLAGTKPLNIGIVGFGTFGQFLSKRMSQKHRIACIDKVDKSKDAQTLGVEYYPLFDMGEFLEKSDIIIVAVPMIDFEDVILTLPADRLRGKLVVEVCPLSAHPKSVLLRHFGPEVDILSTHPMFGPTSKEDPYSSPSWDGRPLVYEKVRIMDARRCDDFLSIFEDARCQLVEMTAEQHDASTADAEFVTHLTGRLLDRQLLPATPVSSKEYAALCDVADMTSGDSFDLFFGMFKFNDRAKEHLNKMRDNLARVERQLAAKEAYIEAREEMKATDRQRLISETKSLLQDIIQSGELSSSLVKPAASTPPGDPQESSKGSKKP
jgi:prephenate dehydratase/prephenate dehydrogenase